MRAHTTGSTERQAAFTLIELLIVVAIIAILAAIAVPNFLEAQVRSKVARTVADQRSLAVGIESYLVDHNRYVGRPQYEEVGWDDADYWLVPLTTPIAYLTQLPEFPWKPWSYAWTPDIIYTYYDYNARASWTKAYEEWGGNEWHVFDPTDSNHWALYATGPDGELNTNDWSNAPGCCHLAYDATNGTTSLGDIIRLGP